MTKKRDIYRVQEDLSDIISRNFNVEPETIREALSTITKQMEVAGRRPRTISDYITHVGSFIEITGLEKLKDINPASLYYWLEKMEVSNSTKLIRLKCVKAFLSKCYDNGWFDSKFWKVVNVEVDEKIKPGTSEKDINILLSKLDFSDFVQLRDGTAALLMYKTGIRLNTLKLLQNKHIDFEINLLKLDGSVMKNRKQILLPIDEVLNRLLSALIKQNNEIRKEFKKSNEYVFITRNGDSIARDFTNNTISKNLLRYEKRFGLKNLSPHNLRRAYAKNLYNSGADIAVISKALGHSDIAVTTRYLHLNNEEVAKELRKYLR